VITELQLELDLELEKELELGSGTQSQFATITNTIGGAAVVVNMKMLLTVLKLNR
jgi:hypothetical protein